MRARLLLAALLALPLALAFPGRAHAGGHWVWPLPSPDQVLRGFEPPPQPWLAGHRGVDLAGRPGAPVRAAGSGRVSFAGEVAGMPVVTVRHESGLTTTYQPVRPTVRAGDAVTAGQMLGRLEPAGSHCAPDACLHWGLRRGPDYLDPLALLHANRVRLLPLGPPSGSPSHVAPIASVAGLGAGAWALRRARRRSSCRAERRSG